jgi:hypothetical protein
MALVKGIFEGCCSTRDCDDEKTVLQRAHQYLHNDNFGDYSLSKHNCETFAYFCKTGELYPFGSKQVLRGAFKVAVGAAIIL